MKKVLLLLLMAVLFAAVSGCGGILVDTNTLKSGELSAEYDFYEKSVNEIRVGMMITPEQADEVFIMLVKYGLNGKITAVNEFGKNNTQYYTVYGDGGSFDVYLKDGVIETLKSAKEGGKIVYPVQAEPTSEPSSESPITLEKAVDNAIKSARAEKINVVTIENAGTETPDDMNVNIYLKGKDNLTTKMVRDGILIQANDILKSLQSRPEIAQVCLFWSMQLVDSYGNKSDWNVVKILIKKETLDKISFNNFDWNKLPEIADDYYEHASLK